MTRRIVVDASALVAVLLDAGPTGVWAAAALRDADLAAPALLPFEVANIIRRHEASGLITSDQAALAHADLLDMAIELWPYDLLAARVWQVRRSHTADDAAYVALAELLETTLVTLDRRIRLAPGLRCPVLDGPPGGDVESKE